MVSTPINVFYFIKNIYYSLKIQKRKTKCLLLMENVLFISFKKLQNQLRKKTIRKRLSSFYRVIILIPTCWLPLGSDL